MTGNEEMASVADDRYDTASIYGWLPIAVADDVSDAGVLPIRVHSDEVVLWRGESGQLHALNAYCAHLGHHLGYGGRVCGEDVRCFYHAWRWSPEGTNTDVPYDRRTYKGRRLGRWSVAERAGLAYIWHPGSGDKATPGRPAPEIDGFGRGVSSYAPASPQTPGSSSNTSWIRSRLAPFCRRRPLNSVVTSRTDSVIAIHHEFAEREPVDVEIYDAASVVLRTGAWSLLIGVCPVAPQRNPSMVRCRGRPGKQRRRDRATRATHQCLSGPRARPRGADGLRVRTAGPRRGHRRYLPAVVAIATDRRRRTARS